MGSGLSAGSDIDMQALINGGPQFTDRLAKLQAEATKADNALKDLNLGKSAAQAHTDHHRLLATTKEKCDADIAASNKYAEDSKARIDSHEAATKAATNDALNAAFLDKTEAAALRGAAFDVHKQAITTRADAEKKMADADAYHKATLSDADAQKAKLIADAQKIADQHISDAKSDRSEAAVLKAELEDKLAKLKSFLTSG